MCEWLAGFVQALVKMCGAATLLMATPSMVQQIRQPSARGLLLAMANSGFAFFLFSYQVGRSFSGVLTIYKINLEGWLQSTR
jgi:ALG6, ALG8 glycosyltransferase family